MMTITSNSPMRLRFLFYVACASSFLMFNVLACRPDQIQSLLQFKSEFESNDCNLSDYFNGVLCDNMTGVVTKLQLPSGCFTGILKPNSSLFGFHHLRYLNLSHNNFTSSSLPFELSNLNRLEVLSLASNGFIGQVPPSVRNLILLSSLDLSHNEFTGSFPLVENLNKLSILDLSYNHFSGTIPSSLLTLPFLSYLDLRGNHLTGPIKVSAFSRLEHLFLGNNHFEGQILEPISNLLNLKDLDLSFLNISYPIDLGLFSSLKSLQNLALSGNILSPESLGSDSDVPLKLSRLMLKNCDINGEFPKFLKKLQNLRRLDLSSNRIKGKIPEWFWSFPRLKIVNLSNNSFDGFDGSEEILRNSSVTMLDFSLNAFKGKLPAPPLLINLFSAWNNSFTGDIPLSICNRSYLTALDLSYNNFTGSVPPCLSKLATVNLRKNNLQGGLPDTFDSNSVLETVDVGYNQISGELPRSLMNCSFLKFLSVEHNKIKDAFPFWLKVLPALEVLTLRSNKFYRPISPPQGPSKFPKLRILEVSNNSFTGSLSSDYFVTWSPSPRTTNGDEPMYMGDYKNALYQYFYTLDLRYKGLYMEHEKVLTFYSAIDFSANRLSGQIPKSIGLLTALIALNLSNNSFTRRIPQSFANLTKLESLDLSQNKLSGKIPQELGTLSFLGYINVSNNQLEGEIPKGTQISGQPKSSFEGNTELCGVPLEETCFETSEPPPPIEEEKHKEEQVLNWKAAAIVYWPGVLFGLAIGHVIALYKPEWLVKIQSQKALRICFLLASMHVK